jgi:fumarate hydratase class I
VWGGARWQLKNANVAAGMVLPSCQDTGTGIVVGKRGQYVWTDGNDEAALSQGIFDTYTKTNLRYSQVAPVDMYTEVNTKTNLPAQIQLYGQLPWPLKWSQSFQL